MQKGNAAQHAGLTRDGRRSHRGGGGGSGERGGLSRALRQGNSSGDFIPVSGGDEGHEPSAGDGSLQAATGEERVDSSGQQGPGTNRHTSANHLLNFQRYDMRSMVRLCELHELYQSTVYHANVAGQLHNACV